MDHDWTNNFILTVTTHQINRLKVFKAIYNREYKYGKKITCLPHITGYNTDFPNSIAGYDKIEYVDGYLDYIVQEGLVSKYYDINLQRDCYSITHKGIKFHSVLREMIDTVIDDSVNIHLEEKFKALANQLRTIYALMEDEGKLYR